MTNEELLQQPAGEDPALSPSQERLWFLDRFVPGTSYTNLCEAYRVVGPLDRDALHHALTAVFARHGALCTAFRERDGVPVPIVLSPTPITIEEVDARDAVDALATAEEVARRPFDLSKAPLVRAALIRLGARDHVVLVCVHRIAADDWSMGILWDEISRHYEASVSGAGLFLEAPPLAYHDVVRARRMLPEYPLLAGQWRFWRETLAGALPTLDLPTDRPRPAVPTFRSGRVAARSDCACVQALRELARSEGATFSSILLAAYATFLARYGGQQDVLIGVPVAGRTAPEFRPVVGPFMNTVVLRAAVDPRESFRSFAKGLHARAQEAYANADLPIDWIVRELRPERRLGFQSLFQTLATLSNPRRPHLRITAATVTAFRLEGGVGWFDFALDMHEDALGLTTTAEFDHDLFDVATAERMAANWQILLSSVACAPDEPLGALALVGPVERHRLLVEWNALTAERPGRQCIDALFAERVRREPEAVAVRCGRAAVTYGELERRANRLARYLQRQGAGPERVIGVAADRSIEMVVALLAILKLGAAFVPIDPEHPRARTAFVLADAGACALVTQRVYVQRCADDAARPTICLEEIGEALAAESADPLDDAATPSSLAYVIYTSGSTGTPKGVMMPHRAVCNVLLSSTQDVGLRADDRFLQSIPLTFDPSVWQLFAPLAIGAEVVLARPGADRNPRLLLRDVVEHGVTGMGTVPAVLEEFLDLDDLAAVRTLRLIMCGGSSITAALRDRCLERAGCPLVNVYGPTEAAIHATVFRTDGDARPHVSIGRPIENARVYVLDASRKPVPIGVTGELYIGGAGVGAGYVNQPQLTQASFVPDPFAGDPLARLYRTGDLARYASDGTLEFRGRNDEQRKLRGARIELGEIAATLECHPKVLHAAATLVGNGNDARVVAYVVARAGAAVAEAELRRFVRAALPAIMVPAAVVRLAAFPFLASGKVDLAALPRCEPLRDDPEAPDEGSGPNDALQQQLIELWEEIFARRPIGVHDDFFALGGHSLLVARMMARIEAFAGRSLPLSTVFSEPTIAGLSRMIRADVLASPQPLVGIQPTGTRQPLFFLHGDVNGVGVYCRSLAAQLGADRPFHAIAPHGTDGRRVGTTIEAMAEENVALVRTVQPRGPYLLGGFCLGGILAYEMARQLTVAGERVSDVILVEADAASSLIGLLQRCHRLYGRLANLGDDWRPRFREARGIVMAAERRIEGAMRNPRDSLKTFVSSMMRRFVAETAPDLSPSDRGDPLTGPVYEAHVRALLEHVPGRYLGRVAVIYAEEARQNESIATIYRNWARVAPNVTIRATPGDHFTCLTRYAADLAAQMRAVLEP